ncbi:MAG: hypothetical protein V3U82_04835 [Robiginitomaculum sp.]
MHEVIANALSLPCEYEVTGRDYLPSKFAVTDLASASIGAVGCAMATLITQLGLAANTPSICVDRRLASLWFGFSIRPVGWEMPPIWDAIAGNYQCRDGWIRLHTNQPRHRDAALSVLGVDGGQSFGCTGRSALG